MLTRFTFAIVSICKLDKLILLTNIESATIRVLLNGNGPKPTAENKKAKEESDG